jgi:GT2 family glycosyltransferase
MTWSEVDISVVMCAYTDARWDELVTAVASLRQQSALPREIIIVIDHNPILQERVRAHVPGVIVVENKERRGLSGARNSGVAVAQGEVVAFIDEDAIAAPDWLERLGMGYRDADVVGVGGPIEPIWLEGRPCWFPEEFDWVVGCTYRGLPRATSAVGRLIGCNMSFRRKVFEAIGGFRSGIGRLGTRPLAGEETELSIRVSQYWPQKVMLYEPRAKVHHRVPASRASWNYYRSRCYCEGLSKALVSRLVGTRDGLASERRYTFRTLPLGVWQGLGDVVLRGDLWGAARAGAILAGLTITTAGYVRGSISRASGVSMIPQAPAMDEVGL